MGWTKLCPPGAVSALQPSAESPFNAANPHYLRIHSDGSNSLGIANQGFRGIGVRAGEPYDFSAWVRVPEGTPALEVQLASADGKVLASSRFTGFSQEWKKYSSKLVPTATDPKASLKLFLATDWKVRRVAADQLPGIIAQHKNARFEVFEYRDGSRKLWISDLRSADFIAPADESTLGLLARQGITCQTRLAEIHGWWYRHPSMLGTSSAQPHPSSSGRSGLSQSTSALGILVLAAAAGSVLWWVVKSRPISISCIPAVTFD